MNLINLINCMLHTCFSHNTYCTCALQRCYCGPPRTLECPPWGWTGRFCLGRVVLPCTGSSWGRCRPVCHAEPPPWHFRFVARLESPACSLCFAAPPGVFGVFPLLRAVVLRVFCRSSLELPACSLVDCLSGVLIRFPHQNLNHNVLALCLPLNKYHINKQT